MGTSRKTIWRGLLIIGLIAGGFIFLLKSCLSQFDERFAMPPVLYFEKDGKAVVLALIQFQEVHSYSNKGGVTRKSIDVEYYLQTNDAITGMKIIDKHIRDHSDIEAFPLQVLGAADNKAWVFIGELMAFDPFTLEKAADIKLLEEKNPHLKDKFPKERTYYVFNSEQQNIFITAKDGSKWVLDLKTLTAAEVKNNEKSREETELAQLDLIEESSRQQFDSINTSASRLFSEGKINRSEYGAMLKTVHAERDAYYKLRDSLRDIRDVLRNKHQQMEDKRRRIEYLDRTTSNYSYMRSNQDTIAGRWFGLYSTKEMDQLHDRIIYESAHEETERRTLYMSDYFVKDGEIMIRKPKAKMVSAEGFLHGGFLLDKRDAEPIRYKKSFLIVHKDQVGQEGKIILSRVSYDGKVMWSFNSELKEWSDWIFTGTRLIALGSAHEDLGSGECNVMWSIDLDSGKAVKYDYFEDE